MAEVVIVDSHLTAGRLVAESIRALISRKPDAVLGLATGATPTAVYSALERSFAENPTDLSLVRGFALDEYVGLPAGHPGSYRVTVTREVVEPLGLSSENVHVPDGGLSTIRSSGSEFERAIVEAGGVDLQILGIGRTGHLGFNEPGSSFASLTRVKTLAQKTRDDNARFFRSADEVPTHCITQGLGTILRARHLVLLAFGESKAEVIAAAVEGPLTASVPASLVQLHPHVTVVIDEDAASSLANCAYYEQAWERKPYWQSI